jgi:hypothetical protein
MGWEQRNGRKYYYAKRRVNGRVVSEYGGAGVFGAISAIQDDVRLARARQIEELQRTKAKMKTRDREIDNLISSIEAAIRAGLEDMGFHRHKGQWRHRNERR